MTVKELLNRCNAHPDVSLAIKTFPTNGYDVIYEGLFDEMRGKQLDWEVYTFNVTELSYDFKHPTILRMEITLEHDTHLK